MPQDGAGCDLKVLIMGASRALGALSILALVDGSWL